MMHYRHQPSLPRAARGVLSLVAVAAVLMAALAPTATAQIRGARPSVRARTPARTVRPAPRPTIRARVNQPRAGVRSRTPSVGRTRTRTQSPNRRSVRTFRNPTRTSTPSRVGTTRTRTRASTNRAPTRSRFNRSGATNRSGSIRRQLDSLGSRTRNPSRTLRSGQINRRTRNTPSARPRTVNRIGYTAPSPSGRSRITDNRQRRKNTNGARTRSSILERTRRTTTIRPSNRRLTNNRATRTGAKPNKRLPANSARTGSGARLRRLYDRSSRNQFQRRLTNDLSRAGKSQPTTTVRRSSPRRLNTRHRYVTPSVRTTRRTRVVPTRKWFAPTALRRRTTQRAGVITRVGNPYRLSGLRTSKWGLYSLPATSGWGWPRAYTRASAPSIAWYWSWPTAYYAGGRYNCYADSAFGSWWWSANDCYRVGRWAGPSINVIVGDDDPVDRPTPTATPANDAPANGTPVDSGLEELAQSHIDLGDYYFREGRYDEAAEAWLRALTYAPDDGSLHLVIADALFAKGDYHYAAFMIRKGLALDPDLALADVDKRTFYDSVAGFEKQITALRSYLDGKRFDAAAWLVLGYNLRFSKDLDGARDALRRCLAIDPNETGARALLDGIEKTSSRPLAPRNDDTAPEPTRRRRF